MRRWIVWVPVSGGLLALLVWRTRPWEALSIAGLQPLPLLGAVALNAVVIGAWAVRSSWLLGAVGHPIRMRDVIPLVSFANTVNNLTPASSGEVARAIFLQRLYAVPLAASSAVIIVERFWAIWIMAVSTAAAAVGSLLHADAAWVAAAWIAAIVLAFAPRLAYVRGWRPGRRVAGLIGWRSSAGMRARLAGLVGRIDDNLATVVRDPRTSVGFVLSTALVFLVTAVQLDLVIASVGVELSLVAAWTALGAATIAGVLSALPFGLGAADVVLVAMLGLLGVDPALAGGVALLYRATVTLPLGLAGTASWIALSRTTARAPGEEPTS